jgi:hypothetical protein
MIHSLYFPAIVTPMNQQNDLQKEREPEGSLCGRKKVMEAGREVESRQSPYESDLRPPLPATKNTY